MSPKGTRYADELRIAYKKHAARGADSLLGIQREMWAKGGPDGHGERAELVVIVHLLQGRSLDEILMLERA